MTRYTTTFYAPPCIVTRTGDRQRCCASTFVSGWTGSVKWLSLLTGARTEELRPLTWSHVDLDGDPANGIPPSIMVWRSVRAGGDTKTRKSRRTLGLPGGACPCSVSSSPWWTCSRPMRAAAGRKTTWLSDAGVPIEDIARLVGHSGTSVTEAVYRKQIRPVIVQGAEVMDRLFPRNTPEEGEAAGDA